MSNILRYPCTDVTAIWGTYYYIHMAEEAQNGVPLKTMSGQSLGPKLARRSWCLAGVEGTVGIRQPDGSVKVYNYAGKTGQSQTSCQGFTGLSPALVSALEKTRWGNARGPFGDGSGGYILAPYRTLAVDRETFPLGTVLYVAKAKGVTITLPDGRRVRHDGYFFAGDTGGAIKGRHVDFFLGVTRSNPFDFVTSSSAGRISARIVTNAATIRWMKALHKVRAV